MANKNTASAAKAAMPASNVPEGVANAVNASGVSVYLDHAIAPFGESMAALDNRLTINLLSDIIGLKQGRTETVPIWRDSPNLDYIGENLESGNARSEVARFLLNRRFENTLLSLIEMPMMRPEERCFNKAALFSAIIQDATLSEAAARVVMELVCGPLLRIGILSDDGPFTHQVYYPFKRTTILDIAREVNTQQIFNGLKAMDVSSIKPHDRQSRQNFASRFAEALRRVGTAMLDTAELNSVVDDIMVGVRANIFPQSLLDPASHMVPTAWRNNPNIERLATCLPFIRAALLAPSNTRMTLNNEIRVNEEYVTVIVNYLRDSTRYKWVGREEVLRHYRSTKIRDMRGIPRAVVVNRHVKAVPTGQAVFAIEDEGASSFGGTYIHATKDRLTSVIGGAYGNAEFSLNPVTDIYADIARDLLGLGYLAGRQSLLVDAVGDGFTLYDIAALLADRLEVELDDDGVPLGSSDSVKAANEDGFVRERDWDPKYWFTVNTIERNFDVRCGVHFGDVVTTSSPVEALIAKAEFNAVDAYPAQPQLLAPEAFDSRVVHFDRSVLNRLDNKMKFSITFAGHSGGGSLKGMQFASLRSWSIATLVKPMFNAAVITTMAEVYTAAMHLIQQAATDVADRDAWQTGYSPSENTLQSIQRRVCDRLLQLSSQLGASFRLDVRKAVIAQIVTNSSLTGEDLLVYRLQLEQSIFAAYADLIALQFFLFLQGIEAPGWDVLIDSEAMAEACVAYGARHRLSEDGSL